MLGMISVLGLLFVVYSFVQPSVSPSNSNFYLNPSSPLAKIFTISIEMNKTNFIPSTNSLTANAGMYNNRIANMTAPFNIAEICFKNGNVYHDFDPKGSSTKGGNCSPGDVGYIIEQNEQSATTWENARAYCLKYNMRLPEPFEWLFANNNSTLFNLNIINNKDEWISNFALPINSGLYPSTSISSSNGYGVIIGNSIDSKNFRCVK